MCLIAINWQPDGKHPLILASNRDEYYARASLRAHYWRSDPDIFGGRDCEKNGTWLAISKTGRLAAVTNYRAPDTRQYVTSRGDIPVQFLKSTSSAEDFANSLQLNQYAGFNALLFDGKDLTYLSNRASPSVFQTLKPGLYGLSNHLLDTPWPKVNFIKQALKESLSVSSSGFTERIFNELGNTTKAKDEELPETGVSKEIEKLLSSAFIESPGYGTRTSTIISLNRDSERKNCDSFTVAERDYKQSVHIYDDELHRVPISLSD